jgi:glycosyltransferase involved in cell wall biosynthesis
LEASILGLLAGKLTGIKKRIFTRHHSSQHHVYHKKGVFWDKLCNYLATNIVAVTRKVKEILIDWEKAEPKKIMVINHGFELKGFDNNNEELILNQKNKYNRDNQFPVIGVVSRFTELKGIQYIIPAFQNLLVDFPQAKILFFNALGDYNFEILELLKTLPANSYQLVKYEENMFLAYRLFDVYIHVPINDHCEAFGQTYIEALAAGVPSIFTLSGIATEFIKDRENALVVDYMNASDIYASMKLLIKDEALAKRISSQGRKDVDAKFDLSIMIKKLESLYQNQIICE